MCCTAVSKGTKAPPRYTAIPSLQTPMTRHFLRPRPLAFLLEEGVPDSGCACRERWFVEEWINAGGVSDGGGRSDGMHRSGRAGHQL